MTERHYAVIIEQTGTGLSAYSPDVSGFAALGDTKEDTAQIPGGTVHTFRGDAEVGEPIPEPNASVDYVKVVP